MKNLKRIITLMTDFGLVDEYVGVMKGVICCHAPDATIIDITHNIDSHNIAQGAMILQASYPYFPHGTIHVAVVDPGVGTQRDILLVDAQSHFFIAPDNGLLTPVLTDTSQVMQVYRIPQPENVSATFHGRDVMAPLAGKLAVDRKPELYGERMAMSECTTLPLPSFTQSPAELQGVVVSADHFGNISTSIPSTALGEIGQPEDLKVCIANISINGINRTYGDVETGEFVALVNSRGFLEIGINCGNAQTTLHTKAGQEITVVIFQH